MKHGFTHTDIEHHEDGSMTVRHAHQDPTKSKAHAVADLDGLHDSLQDHLNEEQLEEKIHPGIHSQIAASGHDSDDQKAEEIVHPGIHELVRALGADTKE